MIGVEATRVDQWLWAVRVFKTRSLATAACRGGHVKVNGERAKPSSPIRVGDRVETRAHDRDRVLEVVEDIDKRVGAAVAGGCYIDHSPPPTPAERVPRLFSRTMGSGRPTKRDRRRTDRLRGR